MNQYIEDFLQNFKTNMKIISNIKMTRSVVNNKITQYKKLDYLVDYHIEYSSFNNSNDLNSQQENYENVVDEMVKDIYTYTNANIDIRLNVSTEKHFNFYAANNICEKTLTELFNSNIEINMQLHLYRLFSHIMPLNTILDTIKNHHELLPSIIDTHLKNPYKSYGVKLLPIVARILLETQDNPSLHQQMQDRVFEILDKYKNLIPDEQREQLIFFDIIKKYLPIVKWNTLVSYTPLINAIKDNISEKDIFSDDDKYLLHLRISVAAIKNQYPQIILMSEANTIMDSICNYLNSDPNNTLDICDITYKKDDLHKNLLIKSFKPIDKAYIVSIFNNVVAHLVNHIDNKNRMMDIDHTIVEACINKAVLHYMLPEKHASIKKHKI